MLNHQPPTHKLIGRFFLQQLRRSGSATRFGRGPAFLKKSILMRHRVIVVTGAAGFLGSAVVVDLARRDSVVAVDRRTPSRALLRAAPGVTWHQADIADKTALASLFAETTRRFSRVDLVLHFAAFYHFGSDWHVEYDRTNIGGTSNVLEIAAEAGTRRLLFASSTAATIPPPPGETLTERTPTTDYIPYGKSKSVGEQMVEDAARALPAIVLRIGGVFSDWCELPPLYSLIKLWTGKSPLSRLVLGSGDTGIPYIHRDDLVHLIRRCVDRHEALGAYEVFLASQHGAVLHKDLFPIIRQVRSNTPHSRPIFVPPALAKMGLYAKLVWGFATGNMPYERPWMLEYVDRPWIADTTYTREKLEWTCAKGMGVRDRLPTILDHFANHRLKWERRNRLRNEARYAYY